MPLNCPKCGAPAPDDARFCEADGTPLTSDAAPNASVNQSVPAAPVAPADTHTDLCPHCQAPAEANVDGWCSSCGRRWRIAPAAGRDHKEIVVAANFAGVSDRGRRHPINEDDFSIASPDGIEPVASRTAILVVCDGVSSSEDAHRASAVAAQSICDDLKAAPDAGPVGDVLAAVIANANKAVNALAPATPGAASDPPETTVVAAVVHNHIITIAWVGDSRAYWIKRDDRADTPASHALTRDHSWMNDVVESGEMTAEDAQKNRLAHAITRCLGGGSAADTEGALPSIVTFAPPAGAAGWLLLCTDGLWNYCDDIDRIAALVTEAESASESPDAVSIARWLAAWANTQGGRDNITVALVRLGE